MINQMIKVPGRDATSLPVLILRLISNPINLGIYGNYFTTRLFLDNRPGMLARVCDALSAAKINIYAITTSDTVDHTVIRMVVSDSRKALLLFEEHGTLVVDTEVLMITGSNKPGSLARISQKLGRRRHQHRIRLLRNSPGREKGAADSPPVKPQKGAEGAE